MILENIVSLSKDVTELITSNKALELYDIYCVNNNIEMDIELDEFEYFVNDNTSDFDNLKLYFADVDSKYRKLSKDEQLELFNRYKNGDTKAFDTLIECNLKLVVSISLKFLNRGLELSDLIEEGNIGLINAINKFDVTKNTKFSTYATYWIKQNISKAIASKSRTVRLPFHLYEKLGKFHKVINKLSKELNREPEIFEIAKEMNISEEKVIEYYNLSFDTVSINSIVGDEDTELEYFIDDKNENVENNYINKELSEHIKKLLEKANLTDKEKTIIKLRYGFYGRVYKLEEIGKMFNCTRERIRQIENRVIRILRGNPYLKSLINYADNPNKIEKVLNIEPKPVNVNTALVEIVNKKKKLKEEIKEEVVEEVKEDESEEEINEEELKNLEAIKEENIECKDLYVQAKNLLKQCSLTQKEIIIIMLRFGFYKKIYTLEEIGQMFNCSRERIRRIENRIFDKLKSKPHANEAMNSLINQFEIIKEKKKYLSNKAKAKSEKTYIFLNKISIDNILKKCVLSQLEKDVVLLRCGVMSNKIITNNEISKILNISVNEVTTILNDALYQMNMYKDYLNFTDEEKHIIKQLEIIITSQTKNSKIKWIGKNEFNNINIEQYKNDKIEEDITIENNNDKRLEDKENTENESNVDTSSERKTIDEKDCTINESISKKNTYDLKLNDEVVWRNIFKKLSNIECIIITLFLGLDLETYKIDDIASFLKIDKEYVCDTIIKSLEMYKSEINDKINNFLLIKK